MQEIANPQDSNKTNLRFKQVSSGGDYIGIGLVNAILGIFTLTLYRFWGKTAVRKRIWSTTHMNEEPFEYTGTGGELFKGFLIATVVFTIPYLIIVFLAQMAGPVGAGILMFGVILLISFVVGLAIWLSFRYLVSHTSWRSIRFGLRGKPMEFAKFYWFQGLLQIVTLGFYTPQADIKIAKELWGNLHYGSLDFNFDDKNVALGKIKKAFYIFWGLALATGILFAIVFKPAIMQPGVEPDVDTKVLLIFPLYFGIFLAALNYRVTLLREIVKAIDLQGVKFNLNVTMGGLFGLLFTNGLIMIFSLGILLPSTQARWAKFIFNKLSAEGEIDIAKANQTERGPDQAEGLVDALDIGII